MGFPSAKHDRLLNQLAMPVCLLQGDRYGLFAVHQHDGVVQSSAMFPRALNGRMWLEEILERVRAVVSVRVGIVLPGERSVL